MKAQRVGRRRNVYVPVQAMVALSTPVPQFSIGKIKLPLCPSRQDLAEVLSLAHRKRTGCPR